MWCIRLSIFPGRRRSTWGRGSWLQGLGSLSRPGRWMGLWKARFRWNEFGHFWLKTIRLLGFIIFFLMTMLQLNALSRGFNGLKWVIDAAPVTILLIFLQRCVYFVLIPPALQQLFNFTWTQTTGEFLFRPALTVPGVCIFDTEEVTQRFPFHSHTQAANEQHTEPRGCLSHVVRTRSCGSAAAPQA